MQIIKKIKSDRDNLKSVMSELEEIVFRNVKERYPVAWDEDDITASLLKEIRDLFNGKRVVMPGNVLNSKWSVYISASEPEHWFGDAVFIFNINYHDGHSTTGAAVIDVNARDEGKSGFSTLKRDHLQRINSGAPHSQVLLYDYDVVPVAALPSQPEAVISNFPTNWGSWMPFTHAVTAPANAVLAMGDKSTGLYKLALPLSYQVCCRYLYGLDLDYSRQSLEIAGGNKPDRGRAKFLIAVSLAFGGAALNEEFDFDRSAYTELK